MNAALRNDPDALRVNLTVPTTMVRLGPIQFDGLKALLGVELADVLSSMMIGPKFQRDLGGVVVDVYPLAIPDGEGLSIPVRFAGEVGFYNDRSILVLRVPAAVIDAVAGQLAVELASGDARGPRLRTASDGGSVGEFGLRLRPGMRKAVPLGRFGELGLEAA